MDRTDRSPRPAPRTRLALALLAGASPLLGLGCATLGLDRGKPLVPTGFQTRTGPFLVCTNGRLDPDAPVVRQLASLEAQVGEALGLRVDPAGKPIEIYLLDDRPTFDHFLQSYYPELPRRRAFFLANGQQRVVYTFLGDRTVEDVRHEATHALLHSAVGDIPLWLDEGLAEYFEGTTPAGRPAAPDTPGEAGVNAEHLDRLPTDLAGGWKPDLPRLEALRSVRGMTPRDYRESWAWVHYLLNGDRPHKAALLAYLGDLRAQADPAPISSRLGGSPDPGPVLAHLDRVRHQARPPIAAADAPPRDPTLRLQSGPTDPDASGGVVRAVGIDPDSPASPTPSVAPTPPATRRKSLLNRMFGWIGS